MNTSPPIAGPLHGDLSAIGGPDASTPRATPSRRPRDNAGSARARRAGSRPSESTRKARPVRTFGKGERPGAEVSLQAVRWGQGEGIGAGPNAPGLFPPQPGPYECRRQRRSGVARDSSRREGGHPVARSGRLRLRSLPHLHRCLAGRFLARSHVRSPRTRTAIFARPLRSATGVGFFCRGPGTLPAVGRDRRRHRVPVAARAGA